MAEINTTPHLPAEGARVEGPKVGPALARGDGDNFAWAKQNEGEMKMRVRGISVFLGLVLLAMFAVGISGPMQASWILWLDLVAAVCAFVIAGLASPQAAPAIKKGSPIGLSVGLFVMWLVALGSSGIPGWLTWFNFAVAVAFLLTGLAGDSSQVSSSGTGATPFRRSA